MRIGIDCRDILRPDSKDGAGIAHYVWHLVRNLLTTDSPHYYVLIFSQEFAGVQEFATAYSTVCFAPQKKWPVLDAHFRFAKFLQQQKLDLYHSTSGSLPLGYHGPSVITIHDLAIYHHPEWFPAGQFFSKDIVIPRSLRKARAIIAVSQETRFHIEEQFHISPEKIHVVYHGVEKPEKSDTDQPPLFPQPYILFIGTFEPRKNIVSLIRAFEIMRQDPKVAHIQLVLAGKKGWHYQPIFTAIKKSPAAEFIHYAGYVTPVVKHQLLSQASLFVFPSLEEGFGLPVLEAMAHGIPVITSTAPVFAEISAGTVLQIEPDSANLAVLMQGMVTGSAVPAWWAKKSLVRSHDFSWGKCARETAAVYESVKK